MKKIGLVLGEPNSINSEILAKAWKLLKKNERKKIIIIGSSNLLNKQFEKLKYKLKLNIIKNLKDGLKSDRLNIIDVRVKFTNPFKVNKKHTKRYVLDSLLIAFRLVNSSSISSFINCPIDKNIFNGDIGVTEVISNISGNKNKGIMMIYNQKFSVVPLTNHMKIKDISKTITKSFVKDKILRLAKSYNGIFSKKANIAVLGLNPHLNELKKNSEERKAIIPAIKELKRKNINVNGPFSVDEIFLNSSFKYNVIVGMYHDQVLGPFKALFGFDAINITIGLNFIRISPDHGTAKKLIFKNRGNPKSLLKGINFLMKQND